jgi:Cft2 family RNA processing exonuclease
MEDSEHIRSSAEEDAATESAVLSQVLALHPVTLTVDELVRELGAGSGEFTHRDDVERAVRDLVAAGLLHRNGSLVLPTRAALRFEQLADQ